LHVSAYLSAWVCVSMVQAFLPAFCLFFLFLVRRLLISTLFPYTTLFRSLAPALGPQELVVSRGGRRVARGRVRVAGARVDHGRADSARSRLLRFLSGRPRPLRPRGATGE